MNSEKVIKGLEAILEETADMFYRSTIQDALALLKAQEPVEPKLNIDEWRCGDCGHKLEHQELLGVNILFHEQYNYCPNCGKAVKWE